MTDEELLEMIEEADRDGDGEIGEEDFIRIMKKSNLFWLIIKAYYKFITVFYKKYLKQGPSIS